MLQALRVLFIGERKKITLFGEQLLENLQRKQREDFFFFFTKPDHSMSWLTAHLFKTILAKRQGEQSGRGRGGEVYQPVSEWVGTS